MGTSRKATALADEHLLLRESKLSASVTFSMHAKIITYCWYCTNTYLKYGYPVLFKHLFDQNMFGDHRSII